MQNQLRQDSESRVLQQQLAEQIQRERQIQQSLQNQIQSAQYLPISRGSVTEPRLPGSSSSVISDVASAVGDLTSSSASALENLTSSGVSTLGDTASSGLSTLVLNPLRSVSNLIRSSFTPTVTTSDVFPVSQQPFQQVTSADVFPSSRLSSSSELPTPPEQIASVPLNWRSQNVTGIFRSWHPSSDPSIAGQSPYPSPEYSASESSLLPSTTQTPQEIRGVDLSSCVIPASQTFGTY